MTVQNSKFYILHCVKQRGCHATLRCHFIPMASPSGIHDIIGTFCTLIFELTDSSNYILMDLFYRRIAVNFY